mmetsp:Transcript_14621/g.36986  ORF Transcript_14621/g.36986 Transcript_14621/m.36986 type:complete len:203 (+) Transcript_14621:1788-2396(+)
MRDSARTRDHEQVWPTGQHPCQGQALRRDPAAGRELGDFREVFANPPPRVASLLATEWPVRDEWDALLSAIVKHAAHDSAAGGCRCVRIWALSRALPHVELILNAGNLAKVPLRILDLVHRRIAQPQRSNLALVAASSKLLQKSNVSPAVRRNMVQLPEREGPLEAQSLPAPAHRSVDMRSGTWPDAPAGRQGSLTLHAALG